TPYQSEIAGVTVQEQTASALAAGGSFMLAKIEPGNLRLFAVIEGTGYGSLDTIVQAEDTLRGVVVKIERMGGAIQGTVEDSSGSAVAGATVSAMGGALSTSTDVSGNYELSTVPSEGTVILSVLRGSDTVATVGVNVGEGDTADVPAIVASQGLGDDPLVILPSTVMASDTADSVVLAVSAQWAQEDYQPYLYLWSLDGGDRWDSTRVGRFVLDAETVADLADDGDCEDDTCSFTVLVKGVTVESLTSPVAHIRVVVRSLPKDISSSSLVSTTSSSLNASAGTSSSLVGSLYSSSASSLVISNPGAIWEAADEVGQFSGDDYNGWWWTNTDSVDGGNSTVDPAALASTDYIGQQILNNCDGENLCITMTLGDAISYPWVSLGATFLSPVADVNMTDKYLCFAYTATQPFRLAIGYADSLETSDMQNNLPGWAVTTASSVTTWVAAFSTATQEIGWGSTVDPLDYVDKVQEVMFFYKGDSTDAGSVNNLSLYWLNVANSPETCLDASMEENTSATTSSSSISSSSSATIITTNAGAIWEAKNSVGQLSGGEYDGWWYSFIDDGDGGNSTVLPYMENTDTVTYDWVGEYIADSCDSQSLCAIMTLGDAIDYPYADIAFNFLNPKAETDVSDKYLCLSYTATQAWRLNLGFPSADESDDMGYNTPGWEMKKATSQTTIVKAFSTATQQSGWGSSVTVSDYLGVVESVKFHYAGSSSDAGSVNRLNIYWVNVANTQAACLDASTEESSSSVVGSSSSTTVDSTEESSSSVSISSNSAINDSAMWIATDAIGQLQGTDYDGYWWTTTDSGDGGNSTILPYLEDQENADYDWIGTYIADECNGESLCLTMTLGDSIDYPYVLAGVNLLDPMAETDVSGKYLCFSYTSTQAWRLNLGFSSTNEEAMSYNLPGWEMKKATSQTTIVKTFSSATQQSGWGTSVTVSDYLGVLESIKFHYTGEASDAGTVNNLNIYWINIGDSEAECLGE
ncbi:MAG TPA: carboxypeptidase-like regulatory domain-containing protein, partial [Fibrobacteraceae bacterium]|nr:carboxypeptidase-like regulatory domain-containing protein [Fibrobacteraceae bacterium]